MSPVLIQLALGLLVGSAISLWPGNTLSVTIREAACRGGAAGVGAALGRSLADVTAVAALGFTVLRYPEVFAGRGGFPIVFGMLAAAALVGFGLRLMENHPGEALHRDRGDAMVREWHRQRTIDRYLGALASPLWHLFWWTAGLRLLAEAAGGPGTAGLVAFGAGYVGAGLLWLGFVALRLVGPRRERALRDRQYRILTSLGGLALVLVGFRVAVHAVAGSGLPPVLERFAAAIF